MNEDDRDNAAAALSASFKAATGHGVTVHVTADGYQPGTSLVLRGGVWRVELPEAEALRFRDWLLLQYPLSAPPPRSLPRLGPNAAKAARAAAWAKQQEKLLKRAWWGDAKAHDELDWTNIIRAVRRVGGLDRGTG